MKRIHYDVIGRVRISGYSYTATARVLRHHATRYRTFLATPLATAVAVSVAANSATALYGVRSFSFPGSTPVCVFFSRTNVSNYLHTFVLENKTATHRG